MKMMNKVCALVLSVALCAGMAAPAFAYGGEPVEEVEQPVLTATPDESDAVTVTDEESGALTPEGNLTLVDDYHTNYRKARDEMQELMKAQKNVEMFFAEEKSTTEKEQAR